MYIKCISQGVKGKKIKDSDLFYLPREETVDYCVTKLELEWEKQIYKAKYVILPHYILI
jgi:hypothetical protein